ncbi:hypothetical protein NQZ68_026418 [Dissostichus eleginoides]|nr:hypothetical protein NQZ68_026418 [Dissostichus eleginoides]
MRDWHQPTTVQRKTGRGSSSGVSSEETMSEDEDETQVQTRRAEVKVAMTMVQHNIPLAFSDHLNPLFKE